MSPQIQNVVKDNVIKQWLSGDNSGKIAVANGVGEGSVTNIVAGFKKGLSDPTMSSSGC